MQIYARNKQHFFGDRFCCDLWRENWNIHACENYLSLVFARHTSLYFLRFDGFAFCAAALWWWKPTGVCVCVSLYLCAFSRVSTWSNWMNIREAAESCGVLVEAPGAHSMCVHHNHIIHMFARRVYMKYANREMEINQFRTRTIRAEFYSTFSNSCVGDISSFA